MKKNTNSYIPAKIELSTLKRIFKDMGIRYSIEENKVLVKTDDDKIWTQANEIAKYFYFYTRVACNTITGQWFVLIGERGRTIRETNKSFKNFPKIVRASRIEDTEK